jgi:type II secretory pathway pseudopilin PulG
MRRPRLPRSARSRPPLSGFTLVELLTSIGIIIFVLSLSVVAFGPALRAAGAKDACRRLRTALDVSRIRAIQQRRCVRFEAQRAFSRVGSVDIPKVPEEWAASPNAGDRQYQWSPLPEFVGIRTSLIGGGLGTPYDPNLTNLGITFGPDSTIKAVYVNGTALSISELGFFILRLESTRDAPLAERQQICQLIKITPLTGVVYSYGSDEAAPADLPTQ